MKGRLCGAAFFAMALNTQLAAGEITTEGMVLYEAVAKICGEGLAIAARCGVINDADIAIVKFEFLRSARRQGADDGDIALLDLNWSAGSLKGTLTRCEDAGNEELRSKVEELKSEVENIKKRCASIR